MAIIGTFTKTKSGFIGDVQTLTLKAKVTVAQVEKNGDKAPDFRVHAGKLEIGAGWNRESENGRKYVSLKIDDPSFSGAIYANLIERDGQYDLLWSR
jgi:uncharacterized protein (DUF736 family)